MNKIQTAQKRIKQNTNEQFSIMNNVLYCNAYNKYDSADITENDVIYLTINCDNQILELENERTRKKYSIPIDIQMCQFPWQLAIGLYYGGDRVRTGRR